MYASQSGLLFDMTKPPPPVDDSFPHAKLLEQLRQSDQVLVQQFMSSRTPEASGSSEKTKPNTFADISSFRAELFVTLKTLEGLKQSKLLLENLQAASAEKDANWDTEIERADQLKSILHDELNALEDEARLRTIAHKLAVRRKKRAWQKRKTVRLQQNKIEQQAEKARRLEEISLWESKWKTRLEKERTAREELQAKTLVLADVRRRKARAKRYLGRFGKTIQLHQQRQAATKRDVTEEKGPQEDDSERFRKDVHALIGEWKAKLAECIREEKLLKDELARRSVCNEGRRRDNRWRKALFGDATAFIDGRQRRAKDQHDVIERRWSWDAYALPLNLTAAPPESVSPEKGYPVPMGWILPSEKPSPEWAVYREPAKIKPPAQCTAGTMGEKLSA